MTPRSGRDANGNDLRELTGYSATLVERVRATNEALVITGTEEGAALGAQSVVLHGLRSIMVAPLQLEGRLLGIVYLDSRVAKGLFTDDDVGVLVAIANHIAVALETARASQLEVAITAATNQRDVAETLRASLSDLSAVLEPEEVLHRLLAMVRNLTGGDAGWLVLGRPGDRTARLIIDTDRREEPTSPRSTIDVDEPLARLLAAEPEAVVESAPGRRPELLAAAFPEAASWIVVPLVTRRERVGVLLLADRDPDAYGQRPVQIAAALASEGMIAYENARLFARVEHLARTDSLTAVATRRSFFDLAGRRMAQARQEGLPLAAMMVDIDLFKRVNDRYGHQAGDEVIQTIAARLSRHRRAEDVVGRYGGEEFAIVLFSTTDQAAAIAERLRRAVADDPIPTSAGSLDITISIGVACLAASDADIKALLARADDVMYAAKRTGRNRVEVSG